MNILLGFNYYQQRGGEEQVFHAEASLLESRGHNVWRFCLRNDEIDGMNRVALAHRILWNGQAYREVGALVRTHRIDVAHFHNTFPLISPAAYYGARRAGAAVIQTLHNYRLVCPGALLSRDGRVCEECLRRPLPWPAVRHKCYRQSGIQTAAVTTMLASHRAIRTWTCAVDRYIALSEFAREKFVEGGLPASKVSVKPNFVAPDPGVGSRAGGYVLFAGRLTAEKGVRTLLEAWRNSGRMPALRIAGDGPLADQVRSAAAFDPRIDYVGQRSRGEILELMKNAACLVFPSLWYEGFPMTIVEAFACALPVLTSGLGTMQHLVADGVTGLHFAPGDTDSLTRTVRRVADHPDWARRMGENARHEFKTSYSPEENYRKLITIYRHALERWRGPSPSTVMRHAASE